MNDDLLKVFNSWIEEEESQEYEKIVRFKMITNDGKIEKY